MPPRSNIRSSGAEAADEARQVQVVVVRGGGGAVEVDEVLRAGAAAGAVEVLADEVLDLDEAVDAAGDGDGALVAEAILGLGLLSVLKRGSLRWPSETANRRYSSPSAPSHSFTTPCLLDSSWD